MYLLLIYSLSVNSLGDTSKVRDLQCPFTLAEGINASENTFGIISTNVLCTSDSKAKWPSILNRSQFLRNNGIQTDP
jgi:hypothetical protein